MEQFSRIYVNISSSDVQHLMCWDDPCYEHMDEKGIVALVSTDQGRDEEEEDEDEPSEIVKCLVSHAEAKGKSTMF